jgi:subtilase family protein
MPPMPKSARRLSARRLAATALALVAVGAAAGAVGGRVAAATTASAQATGRPFIAPAQAAGGLGTQPACQDASAGHAACQSIVDSALHWNGSAWTVGAAPARRPRTSPPAVAGPASAAAGGLDVSVPQPFMAADVQSAYKLPSALLGGRQVIAIVDAYDDPDAASDLAAYRAANHLPACDAAFPCFTKVNQSGEQGDYPPPDPGWALEESVDLDMASATCPNCRIVLVESDDDTFVNLAAAEDEAATLGATVISNSYGGDEYAGESAVAASYDHPGIAITAASGDTGFNGFEAQIPAAFGTVTAVGGTTLWRSDTARGWSEAAWQYAGSGCSAYISKPSWQHDPDCDSRATADVAAVADPDTPVAIYDTYDNPGWVAVGGTSVAAPVVAGIYALAGNAAGIGPGASWSYAHRQNLYDVTAAPALADVAPPANGICGGSYLCTAGPGYDGPTGLGTPNGIGAF